MIKKYLSMLTFQYERTLIYLLQKDHYNIQRYFKRLSKVTDFKKIYKKGAMKETPQAYVLFHILALTVLIYTALVVWWACVMSTIPAGIVAVIIIFLIPIWAQYTIVVPIIFVRKFFKK